jgi:hypothetical protein
MKIFLRKAPELELLVPVDHRFERMNAVCMSEMYFAKKEERLNRLIPQVYAEFAVEHAQAVGSIPRRVDDLEAGVRCAFHKSKTNNPLMMQHYSNFRFCYLSQSTFSKRHCSRNILS